jgi:ABC-type dipeptide/oligopeptide/nickel transport system permease component
MPPAAGLDQSPIVRYLAYMEALLTLDLGWSAAPTPR